MRAARDDIDALIDAYRDAASATWWLHWNPFARPAELVADLAQLGFTAPPRRSWAKMLRGTEDPPSIATELQIAPAHDDQIEDAMQAIARAFEMPRVIADWLRQLHGRPRWRTYAVKDGDAIVGGGCLFLDGECAWLGMGAVLPTHRRRGGQGALSARRIRNAIDAGARYIVTETGEAIAGEANPSLANMKRCGFGMVASRLNFAGPKPDPGR